MSKHLTLFLLAFLPSVLFAQLETNADWKRQVYEKEFTVGIMFHTKGLGVNLRSLKYKNGFAKRGFDFDLVNLRHPKEIKFRQAASNSARGFVYGRLNSFYAIRAGYGQEKVLIDKTDQGSISVSWTAFGGASLGVLKPVYLEIKKGENEISTERYDPAVHSNVQIYGQAPFLTGIDHSKLRLGVYIKTGFVFDYNWSDQNISSIEVGGILDYYPSWFGLYKDEKVPIMTVAENYNLWFQFYLTVNFGRKWN